MTTMRLISGADGWNGEQISKLKLTQTGVEANHGTQIELNFLASRSGFARFSRGRPRDARCIFLLRFRLVGFLDLRDAR